MQGFLFARPAPREDIDRMLAGRVIRGAAPAAGLLVASSAKAAD
jgi:hypothetical protein